MTPIYPPNWKICRPETAFAGGVIPLRQTGGIPPGACENCGLEPPGVMFGFLLDDRGMASRYFLVYGEGVIYRGRMVTAPCPRCGAADRAPASDGGHSRANYWDN